MSLLETKFILNYQDKWFYRKTFCLIPASPADVAQKINTKEEHLPNITQNFGESDTENEDDGNIDEGNNQNILPFMDTEDITEFTMSAARNVWKKNFASNVLNTFIRHA